MLNLEAAIDAKHDYTVELNTKASCRAMRHLKLRNPDDCYGARLIEFTDEKVEWVKVWLTVTFIKFKKEPVPWKFENSSEMRKIAEINDLQGRKGMLQALRVIHGLLEMIGKVEIRLKVPRDGISYERTRSEEFKEQQKIRKAKAKGKSSKKKKYTRPEVLGLRNGAGRSHWVQEENV